MAGERNKVTGWVDSDQHWRPKVCELADSLGHQQAFAWYWFRQLSLCILFETRWPQHLAECLAFQHITSVLDKRGLAPS